MDPDVDKLGEVRQVFRPKIANLVAGMILGSAMAIGGVLAAIALLLRDSRRPMQTGDQIAFYVIIVVLGVALPAGGIAILVWVKRTLSHRVTVFDRGFTYLYGGSTEICAWDDVDKIIEVFTAEELKVLKLPGASLKNVDRSYEIVREDGKKFRFTVNSIDSIPEFGDRVNEAVEKFDIPLETNNR